MLKFLKALFSKTNVEKVKKYEYVVYVFVRGIEEPFTITSDSFEKCEDTAQKLQDALENYHRGTGNLVYLLESSSSLASIRFLLSEVYGITVKELVTYVKP